MSSPPLNLHLGLIVRKLKLTLETRPSDYRDAVELVLKSGIEKMPVDPVFRANNRQLRYRIVRDLFSLTRDLDGDNDIAAANARKSLRDNLVALAPIFSQYPYFMSEEFSLVDLCMAPLLWRLPHYGIKLTSQAKSLMKYSEKLFERSAFERSLSPSEQAMR